MECKRYKNLLYENNYYNRHYIFNNKLNLQLVSKRPVNSKSNY